MQRAGHAQLRAHGGREGGVPDARLPEGDRMHEAGWAGGPVLVEASLVRLWQGQNT